MTNPPESVGSGPRLLDRRHDQRQKVWYSCEVSENNWGRVLNISPNGLALETDQELIGDEFPKMRFMFSPSLSWVEARGRVAWRSKSRKVVGIQFISLPDEMRREIQRWIASRNDSISGSAPLVDTIAAQENIAGGIGKAPRLVGLAFAGAVLVSVFFLRGPYLQRLWDSQKSGQMRVVPNYPAPTSQAVPTSQLVPSSKNPTVTAPDLTSSLRGPAFVLQVGAMLREENANRLATSLSQMSFPAFVVKRPTDRFYYTFVGPYNNAHAAVEAKIKLEKRGFSAVRKEWKVSSQ